MSEPKAAASSAAELHPLIKAAQVGKVPVANLIGFEVSEVAGGRAVGSLQTGPQHANPMGTLHGGILCDLADAAMGMAFVSTLAPDQSFTTVNL
ncbi:MAG: PaaI family thioesterase, partial [Candidatus Acidiferrales bacterium]